MPTSFSRILSESDLQEVRDQYLKALDDLESEEDDDDNDEDAVAGTPDADQP